MMMFIKDVIPKGKENAVHLPELCRALDMPPTALKKAIKELRQQGEPILSGRAGYWYSEKPEEIRTFVDSLGKQAVSRFASVKTLKAAANASMDQITIFEMAGGACNGTGEKRVDLS